MTARDLALQALNSVERTGRFPRVFLERGFREHPDLSRQDRAFIQHLVQGVFRWKLRLDWIIGRAVRFPFRNIQPSVLNILRLALYQLLFMDRVPQSAAVNEAVSLARKHGPAHVARFVNGILREICRRDAHRALPDPAGDRVEYLSIAHSYPPWLVEKWLREWGAEAAQGLLESGNRIPDLVLRANTLKIDRPGLVRRLETEGLSCTLTRYAPSGVRLEGIGRSISGLHSFGEGLWQVQDEAAQICSLLLAPKPGERVLDVCAGLGGKSTHMAAIMSDRGLVLSLDSMHGRLISLTRTARRLGIRQIRPLAADACAPLGRLFRGRFHRALLDAPCSGLGVLSRHPDGKWRRGPEDIPRLGMLQSTMLRSVFPALEAGGELLYTVCTLSREENENVVERALSENRGIRLQHLGGRAAAPMNELVDDNGFYRTLPHIHGMDGFFGALFRRDAG